MGIFNFLKKKERKNLDTNNGILGPTFLDEYTTHIENPINLHSHEWRRKLKLSTGQTKFKIKYYGELHQENTNLIVGTDFAPTLILAIDNDSGKEILLFDGCKHGYNAMFCDTYSNEQVKNRPVTKYYSDNDGNELFEIVISTYNGISYEDEFREEVDDKGLIELIDGSKVDFEQVKRNGYDTLQIWVTNKDGKTIDFVSEELA